MRPVTRRTRSQPLSQASDRPACLDRFTAISLAPMVYMGHHILKKAVRCGSSHQGRGDQSDRGDQDAICLGDEDCNMIRCEDLVPPALREIV
jgi:hypothetical protein